MLPFIRQIFSDFLYIIVIVYIYYSVANAQVCPHDGDVNQDGNLTPGDALQAFQHFLGRATPALDDCQQAHANAENPQSSSITPGDALCIFQRFLRFLRLRTLSKW